MSATLLRIGVLGDSDSDEYAFADSDRRTAKNYVEQLAEKHKLDFGEYATTARASPRGAGYANDWAHSGHTSSDIIAEGQVRGLAGQAGARQITTAIVYIGSNDISQAMKSKDPASRLPSVVDTVMQNITKTIRRLRQAQPKLHIIVATVADISLIPNTIADYKAGLFTSAVMDEVKAATTSLNQRIAQLPSSDPRIAVADVAGEVQKMVAERKLSFGGVDITTDRPGDTPTHLFLADGLHMGTVGQGMIANTFLRTLRSAFGTDVKLLTSAQILGNAHLKP